MSTIANISAQPNFQGSIKRSENGTPYYKGNAGLIAGSVLGADFLWQGVTRLNKKNILNDTKDPEYQKFITSLKENSKLTDSEIEKLITKLKKTQKALPYIVATKIGLAVGCGALVDYITNQNSKKASQEIAKYGPVNASMINDNIDLTLNSAYYKSNDGKKYGTLLGLGVGGIFGAILAKHPAMSVPLKKAPKEVLSAVKGTLVTTSLFVCTLGGLIMGAITDYFNNSGAKKASIKQATLNQLQQ